MKPTSTSSVNEKENPRKIEALASAVSNQIYAFRNNFYTAITVIRLANELNELDVSLEKEKGSLEAFFQILNDVEKGLFCECSNPPFVVAVEGLRGVGKTELIKSLAKKQKEYQIHVKGDLPFSVRSVREVFEKCGGSVSRAFYMISNYILQYEMREESEKNPSVVFFLDSWYGSTCAYSLAYRNTKGSPQALDELGEDTFRWSQDLGPPNLPLLLLVDDQKTRERLRVRGNLPDNSNPWNNFFSNGENVRKHIMRASHRVKGIQEVVILDGNQPNDAILEDAGDIISQRISRFYEPWVHFRCQPLEYFRWTASQFEYCDPDTGLHLMHRLWQMQIALNVFDNGSPYLRSVRIHRVDKSGILFFAAEESGGGGGTEEKAASIVCVMGEYPNEQQWRAEGILNTVTGLERELMHISPIPSGAAQIIASMTERNDAKTIHSKEQRTNPLANYDPLVARSRCNGLDQAQLDSVVVTRFIPLRMELLIGSLGSGNKMRQYEWYRQRDQSTTGWSDAKLILPFTSSSNIICISLQRPVMPVTLALTGTHCSGKATLGKRLAQVLSWLFHNELGDVLRDKDNLNISGHKMSNSTFSDTEPGSSWDDKVYNHECERDSAHSQSRVVETWHIGNLAWALFRTTPDAYLERKRQLFERTKKAVQYELERASVLFVHLSVSPETSLRRHGSEENARRLPLKNDNHECLELHEALDTKVVQLLDEFSNMKIPVLHLDNSTDGEEAITNSIQQIMDFVNSHTWRRALPASVERLSGTRVRVVSES